MKNANRRVLLIAAGLVVLAALAGLWEERFAAPAERQAPQTAVRIEPDFPKATEQTQAYLRVQVDGDVWPLIPLTDGGEYRVLQPTGEENVIHTTTAVGVVMHASTCKNQQCVAQGEATLDNRGARVMGSLIVCLPNRVILEILTPQEAGVTEAANP